MSSVVVTKRVNRVVVTAPGPQGVAGPAGATGPTGPPVTGFAFDASRNNIVLGDDNAIVDGNAGTNNVTLTGAGGTQPNRIGTSTHTTAGFVALGTVVARRTYYVTGSTGAVTYNAVAYTPGQTFVGVYGVKTFTATGDSWVKDNTSRQVDASYINGTAYVASILGGYDHLNNQIAGTICGGGHNELRSAGNHSTIVGGSYNLQKAGLYSVIVGGTQNQQSQDFGVIVGGWGNWITSDNVSGADESAIVVGQENQIQDVGYGFIGTGLNQRVLNPNNTAGMNYNTLLNGTGCVINGGFHNFGAGLNLSFTGDSGGYNTQFGSNNSVSGTCAYNLIGGSSTTVTDSPRVLSLGTIVTITGSTMAVNLGDNASIIGATHGYTFGNANSINGTNYTYLFGRSLSAADGVSPKTSVADYGTAAGFQATIRSFGQRVESNGNESSVNVQRSRYLAKRRALHTTGVAVQLRLDGSVEGMIIPTNSVWTCRAMITAVQSTGAKFGMWTLDFAVRDVGGVVSILGSPSAVMVHNGHSSTWSVSAAVHSNASYVSLVLSAQALNDETVTWGAAVDAMELNGAW